MQGKVVFVAPTKPLVAQQIQACYRFMGVPKVTPQGTPPCMTFRSAVPAAQ